MRRTGEHEENTTVRKRAWKYGNDKKVRVKIDVDIPEGEHTILVMFANGISMPRICIETGCNFRTVSSIVRGNLREILGLKGRKDIYK